jgi:hypothetical protein
MPTQPEPGPVLELKQIWFSTPSGEGPPEKSWLPIPVRRNGKQAVVLPEWRQGACTVPEHAPLCLARDEAGPRVGLWVRIDRVRAGPSIPRQVSVRVEAETRRVAPALPDGQEAPGSILGSSEPAAAKLKGGTTGLVGVDIPVAEGASWPAGIYELRLRWFLAADGGPEELTETTLHRLYLLHARPGGPWQEELGANRPFGSPWTEALDLACAWGGGTTDPTESARRITRALHGLAPVLRYASGDRFYSAPSGSGHQLFLGELLRTLRRGRGRGAEVNCDDCALAVCALSNLVGCRLSLLAIYDLPGFDGMRGPLLHTNQVVGIGWTGFRVVNEASAYNRHLVACEPGPDPKKRPLKIRVFDAALRLPERRDKAPVLPPVRATLCAGVKLKKYLRRLATGPTAVPGWKIKPTFRVPTPGPAWPYLKMWGPDRLHLASSNVIRGPGRANLEALVPWEPPLPAALFREFRGVLEGLLDARLEERPRSEGGVDDGDAEIREVLKAIIEDWAPYSHDRRIEPDAGWQKETVVLHRDAEPDDGWARVLHLGLYRISEPEGGVEIDIGRLSDHVLNEELGDPVRAINPTQPWRLETTDRRTVVLVGSQAIVTLHYDRPRPE